MQLPWLKLLLLATFAYWATGAARFVHEAVEHRGLHQSAEVDDDDDAPVAHDQPAHHGHPCPVCQMLAAMVAEQPGPSLSLTPTFDWATSLVLVNHTAPWTRQPLTRLTTGPPHSTVA